MTNSIFADDFQQSVFWLDGQDHQTSAESQNLPARVDAVVIGSGLAGSSAAHALAIGGRDVIVIDRGSIGGGASSRNAGMLGKGSRASYLGLAKAGGHDAAKRYFSELQSIYDEAVSRIRDEQFDCELRESGRFIGALRPDHLERLIKEYEARAEHLGEDVSTIRGAPEGVVGSNQYFGGVFLKDSMSVQPASYTAAMVRRAADAGARFFDHTMAKGISRIGDKFEVQTSRGTLHCNNVVVATNGYGGRELPFATARLLPINAYMVLTEELPQDLLDSVCPARSTNVDSTRANRYYQLTSDGRRLIFGARSGRRPPGPLTRVARGIHQDLSYLFPQLAGVKFSRLWAGRCAAPMDLSPHLIQHDGVHYAVGFSFTGLALAPYLGRLAGEWIVSGKAPQTAFANAEFQRLPRMARLLRPLSAPVATRYFAWVDRPVRRV